MANLHGPTAWEQRGAEIDSAPPLLQALGAECLVLIEATYTGTLTGEHIVNAELSDGEWVSRAAAGAIQ